MIALAKKRKAKRLTQKQKALADRYVPLAKSIVREMRQQVGHLPVDVIGASNIALVRAARDCRDAQAMPKMVMVSVKRAILTELRKRLPPLPIGTGESMDDRTCRSPCEEAAYEEMLDHLRDNFTPEERDILWHWAHFRVGTNALTVARSLGMPSNDLRALLARLRKK